MSEIPDTRPALKGLSRLRSVSANGLLGSYIFVARCPRCGELLEPVATSKVVALTQASAIARCPECPREWQITVLLRTSAPKIPAVKRRGTRLLQESP